MLEGHAAVPLTSDDQQGKKTYIFTIPHKKTCDDDKTTEIIKESLKKPLDSMLKVDK